jgi:hypothetical protein
MHEVSFGVQLDSCDDGALNGESPALLVAAEPINVSRSKVTVAASRLGVVLPTVTAGTGLVGSAALGLLKKENRFGWDFLTTGCCLGGIASNCTMHLGRSRLNDYDLCSLRKASFVIILIMAGRLCSTAAAPPMLLLCCLCF